MIKKKYLPGERAAQVGVFMLISFFPIFVTKAYSNITATKYFTFSILAAFFLALCLICKVATYDFTTGKLLDKNKEISKPDLFYLLFVIVAIVSTVSSRFPLASLGGGGGRRMGLVMILATFFAYIFISKFYRTRPKEFYLFGGTVIFSSIFGFFQFLGFDPLNMLVNLRKFDFTRFISFSGNINVHASFICIGAPFAMYMFCHALKKKDFYFWLTVSVCGFIGLLTCNSDSGYLGIFVSFVVLAILSAKQRKSFIRYLVLVATFFLTCGFFRFMRNVFEDQSRNITFLGRIVTNPAVVMLVSVNAILFAGFLYFSVFEPKHYKSIQKAIIILMCTVVGAFALIVFWFTIVDKETDLGMFNYYFRFNDSWGTERGYVWTRMLRIFRDFPFYRKLIGSGPDTAAFELVSQYGHEMRTQLFYYFDSAHNDVIQYLVTLGLWGALTYLLLVFTSAKSGLESDSVYSRAAVLSVIAFFAQGFVNINQPITTPLIFVFMGLTQCKKYEG